MEVLKHFRIKGNQQANFQGPEIYLEVVNDNMYEYPEFKYVFLNYFQDAE